MTLRTVPPGTDYPGMTEIEFTDATGRVRHVQAQGPEAWSLATANLYTAMIGEALSTDAPTYDDGNSIVLRGDCG